MQHRIIVLGAGYTGAIAAGRLAKRLRREDVAITLVNAEPDFVERVRMHQLATGQDLKPRPFSEMFAGTGVELRLAKVTAVDVDRKTVAVTDAHGAEELAYDTLVYALGSGWNDHGVPGAAEHAYEIAGRPGALRLRERLARLDAGQTVVVVGGGLTGLEAATEIAEARPDLDVALAAQRRPRRLALAQGPRSTCGRSSAGSASPCTSTPTSPASRPTASPPPTARTIPAAVTVWTTGFAVHPIARRPPWRSPAPARSWSTGPCARSRTRTCTPSATRPWRWARGTSRCGCRAPRAVPTAWQAADAIAARLTGGKLPNAPLRYFNQCISLGRKEGLIQYVTADDRAVRAVLTGRLAAVYKELICKGAAWGVANPTLGLPTRRRHITREQAATGPAVKEPA